MEDQPFRRSRRLQNLPFLTTVEPPLPPQRQILDTDNSFELVGISEVPGELELKTNKVDTTVVEIQDLQDHEFARKFNSPLTDLNDHVILQVLPIDSPVIGVPVRSIMEIFMEGMSTPTSALPIGGVPLPL